MIGGNYTETTREAWTSVPGRSVEITNDANGNPTAMAYKEGTTTVFVKRYTYDANGNCTKIECSNS